MTMIVCVCVCLYLHMHTCVCLLSIYGSLKWDTFILGRFKVHRLSLAQCFFKWEHFVIFDFLLSYCQLSIKYLFQSLWCHGRQQNRTTGVGGGGLYLMSVFACHCLCHSFIQGLETVLGHWAWSGKATSPLRSTMHIHFHTLIHT